jgi:hypothetical protein
MAALARTPSLPEVTLVGELSAEAVRKFLRVFTQTYFVRFFEPSDRLEAKKSRQISLCSTSRRISPSFRTAYAQLRHRLSGAKRLI